MGLDFRVAMGRAYRPSVLLAFGLVTTSPSMPLAHSSEPVPTEMAVDFVSNANSETLERVHAKHDELDSPAFVAVRSDAETFDSSNVTSDTLERLHAKRDELDSPALVVVRSDAETSQSAAAPVEALPPPLEGGLVAPAPTPAPEIPTAVAVEVPNPPANPAPPAPKSSPPINAGTGNHFYYGYCTWYVANRRPIPWRGNAWEWWANARQFGFEEGQEPRVGAIMVLGIGPWSPLGHVAYVESVNDDGSFAVSEMNWGRWGVVTSRTITSRQGILGFIY